MEILGVSHKTLTKYEKSNYLISNKYKREKYYTTENILDCIKSKTVLIFDIIDFIPSTEIHTILNKKILHDRMSVFHSILITFVPKFRNKKKLYSILGVTFFQNKYIF